MDVPPARKVVVTKDETTVVDGAVTPSRSPGGSTRYPHEIDNTDSDDDREKLQERLAKLAGALLSSRRGRRPRSS